jgi:hypothetical protein
MNAIEESVLRRVEEMSEEVVAFVREIASIPP